MRMDRRVKYDVGVRRKAVELFASGMGSCTVASTLSVPLSTVKTWHHIYHAFGSEVLLTMDGKQALYTYEQKVAAARAVIEGGMTRTEAMAKFKIMSLAPLKHWCKLYRTGGAEALKPKPKGRPKGSLSKPQKRTREQELEERCRRLETKVAYLKKLRALVEKDEFFRGRTWPNFESFKTDLDAYVMYWNTQRRQVKLKGLTPEEFRNQSFVA